MTATVGIITPNNRNVPKYTVNDQCTKCGVCAKVCPTRNIIIHKKVNFGNNRKNIMLAFITVLVM